VGDLDQAIVGSGPDEVDVFGRWCDGVDDAAMLAFGGIVGDEGAEGRGNSGVFTSQVRADDLPTVAAVGGLEEDVRSEIKDAGIDGREEERRGAIETVVALAQDDGGNVAVCPVLRSKTVTLPP